MPAAVTVQGKHDCSKVGCDVSLNGIALRDVQIYVVRSGVAEVVQTVPKGAPLPRSPPTGPKMPNLSVGERPWTRKVA